MTERDVKRMTDRQTRLLYAALEHAKYVAAYRWTMIRPFRKFAKTPVGMLGKINRTVSAFQNGRIDQLAFTEDEWKVCKKCVNAEVVYLLFPDRKSDLKPDLGMAVSFARCMPILKAAYKAYVRRKKGW